MSHRFTRNIPDIDDIKDQGFDTNEQNDDLSDVDGRLYKRTYHKDTKEEMYWQLTDAIKTINGEHGGATKEGDNDITYRPRWSDEVIRKPFGTLNNNDFNVSFTPPATANEGELQVDWDYFINNIMEWSKLRNKPFESLDARFFTVNGDGTLTFDYNYFISTYFTWSRLNEKPFESIGSDFSVNAGVLSVNFPPNLINSVNNGISLTNGIIEIDQTWLSAFVTQLIPTNDLTVQNKNLNTVNHQTATLDVLNVKTIHNILIQEVVTSSTRESISLLNTFEGIGVNANNIDNIWVDQQDSFFTYTYGADKFSYPATYNDGATRCTCHIEINDPTDSPNPQIVIEPAGLNSYTKYFNIAIRYTLK